MSTTAERLEDFKFSRTPTPLWVFLYIYEKAHKSCYPSYLDGAEHLHDWLTNNRTIPLALPPIPQNYHLPNILGGSYEMLELAKVIVGSSIYCDNFDQWLTDVAKVQYAIYVVTADMYVKDML